MLSAISSMKPFRFHLLSSSLHCREMATFLWKTYQIFWHVSLAETTEPLRYFLKKEGTWEWQEKRYLTLNQVQIPVKKWSNCHTLTYQKNANSMRRQLGRFIGNTNAEQRKRGLGLGIVPNRLRIKRIYQWSKPLVIVGAVEHGRNYMYVVKFEVFLDIKALKTALKSRHENKTCSGGLTRWIDRLLQFDMEIGSQGFSLNQIL